MPYQRYTASDFALDKKFQQWVLHPDEESNRFWNSWMAQHPGKRREVTEAIKLIRSAGLSADTEANTAYLEVWHQLQATTRMVEKNHRKQEVFRYSRIAAVWIAFLLLAAFLVWDKIPVARPVVYATGYGKIKKVVLADGSIITLNANSSLQVPVQDWEKAVSREVFLTGEAFFEIARTRDKKKFIVYTPDSVAVQVLGTAFNVNTRRQKTAVYLQSGKVQLKASSQEVVLQPGQLAQYNKQVQTVTVRLARKENLLAWKSNFFIFDDVPLADIARELEDNYGTKIMIANDSLARRRFTARVPRNKMNVLLTVLAETLQVDIIRQNNEIRMQPKPVPARKPDQP